MSYICIRQRKVMANRTYIYIILVLFFLFVGRVSVWAEVFVPKDNVGQKSVLSQHAWLEVYRWVNSDTDVLDRQEVLMLIRYHYDDIEKLEKLLRYLDGGKPYAYLTQHIFPRISKWNGTKGTLSVAEPPLPVMTLPTAGIEPGSIVPPPVEEERKERSSSKETILALKNNLLYDLALAPNIEIELPIGRRWSLNAEYKCPWWLNSSRSFCYQLLSGGIEARYWLGNRQARNRLTGHFLGVYAEGGRYDFQFGGEDGYQGKYYGAAGLAYGYSRQLARHLAIEFSLGVGYLTTEYRKYSLYEDDLIWKTSNKYNFIGPTKAKISLVWLITGRR